jgi:hypothetical protein
VRSRRPSRSSKISEAGFRKSTRWRHRLQPRSKSSMRRPRRSAAQSPNPISAAQEVASKISSVSSEASAVDARANEVRNAVTGVSSGLSSLKSVLVSIVRSATEDADRHRWPRFRSHLPIRITGRAQERCRRRWWTFPRPGLHSLYSRSERRRDRVNCDQGFDHDLPFIVRSCDAKGFPCRVRSRIRGPGLSQLVRAQFRQAAA